MTNGPRTQAWHDGLTADELDVAKRIEGMPMGMAVQRNAVELFRHSHSSRWFPALPSGAGAALVLGVVKALEMRGWL